ncbi:interleukin 6 (interferon, beta 2) precursor [Silurus asotus]|uniref:Interleukin-6 n=1 Tax=Silurus asotus TaxID=30991 RepID=A0AAD5AT22_SILAS|nr:interleukin 6 (interferon, beta 2) precursor [Silurus asotus]
MPYLLHHYLGLLLLPLLSLGLYSGDEDYYDFSGGELQNEAHASFYKWFSIARQMRIDIHSVRDEQFARDFAGMRNMSDFDHQRIETPLLGFSDGCLPFDFKPQKCVQQIYTGLRVYQAYLPYVDNGTSSRIPEIKVGMARLLGLIKGTGNVHDVEVHPAFLRDLVSGTQWRKKTVTHSILYNFVNFMIVTSRAINYMKAKKLMKHAVKEDKWLSKHVH